MSSGNLGAEQAYVSMLYDRLDELRQQASDQLAAVLLDTGGTMQARSERDAHSARCTEQVATLTAVEHGLCFGRLDLLGDQRHYIGRLGIFDDDRDRDPLLLDWRAPAARPFYLATGAAPEGVRRRRHIRTHGRRVVGVDDEDLDVTAANPRGRDGVAGETALLAAMAAARGGHMRDIVETIQAEQDRIIRGDHRGVLVVQGGPGTGKTAVALHRAAFLLYTYRRQLSRRGVLIVGPNPTFLHYIEQVLPSLGETGVVLATIGTLFPGVVATAAEPPAGAAVKGALTMVEALAAAVADRQQVPPEAVDLTVDGAVLTVEPAVCERARDRARATGRPHNQARAVFIDEVLDALAATVADQLGADPFGGPNLLSPADRDDIRSELADDATVLAALDRWWPVLTPQRLLRELYASPQRLAAAGLPAGLLRVAGGWSPADVPLLDEVAELLGDDDDAAARARVAAARRQDADIAYAQGVLDIVEGSRSYEFEDEADTEILAAADLLAADRLAGRHQRADRRSVAERAAADRRWAYGHVILDEAQELSAMAMRMLLRRCPSRSMTIVGDVAQTGDVAGAGGWPDLLDVHLDGRWRLERLTVNYRTPEEIMAVAGDVLAVLDATQRPPASVRSTGHRPWRLRVPAAQLPGRLAGVVAGQAGDLGTGRLAVIVPASRLAELGAAVAAVVPAAVGDRLGPDDAVVVVTATQVKGLEFDRVIVVDPARIIEGSSRGLNDVYVALTRATQRLGVVCPGPVPAVLSRLRTADGGDGPWSGDGSDRRNGAAGVPPGAGAPAGSPALP
ncbi:MAG: AAA family ATPase [Dactylosporangium sp.]|nr:AAA family ATPase [Dactylosporangium sp.]